MVPKVTPYDVDLDPFASCPDIQSVCEINVPNDIQPLNTLKLCKNVRQEDAVVVVWKVFDVLGERIQQQKHHQGFSHLLQMGHLLENQQQCMQKCLC